MFQADKMLRHARKAASTGRTAALGRHGQWPQWAGSDRLGKFDTSGGLRTFAARAKSKRQIEES
jgi:hypothetical protein